MVFVRDGRAPMTGPVNMNSNKITNVADGTQPQDVATVSQSASMIGDFKDTVRVLDSKWLRRNGGIYSSASYPDLADLLGPLPSGFIWEQLSTPFGSATPGGIASGMGRLAILVGATVYWSENGSTWNAVAIPFSGSSISYGGGRFVVLGSQRTAVSEDGCETWQATGNVLEQIVTGGIRYSSGLFAVAHSGPANVPPSKISTSPDGIVWTTRLTAPDLRSYILIIGDDIGFVACDATFFYTSSDGITWTTVTPDVTIGWVISAIRLAGGNVILFGSSGQVRVTTDFQTTVASSSGTSSNLNSSVFCDPFAVIVGNGGIARLSSDEGNTFTGSITGVTANLTQIANSPFSSDDVMAIGPSMLLKGTRTGSNQFRVPNDNPTTGWIKAL